MRDKTKEDASDAATEEWFRRQQEVERVRSVLRDEPLPSDEEDALCDAAFAVTKANYGRHPISTDVFRAGFFAAVALLCRDAEEGRAAVNAIVEETAGFGTYSLEDAYADVHGCAYPRCECEKPE